MSRMRTLSHQDHESNLDALLEDLQTTVSRSNSQLQLNGGTVTTSGFREVRRTVTDGTPGGTSTEYQIEYVNPANTSHHVSETNTSYNSNNSEPRQMYKAEAYSYNSSQQQQHSSNKMKQNISELDSLLEDLNAAQKKSFAEGSSLSRHTGGIDSGLLEGSTGQPSSGRLLEEKRYKESRSLVRSGNSPALSGSNARRELVFTGNSPSREPSPLLSSSVPPGVRQQAFYRYEKTTTSQTTAPLLSGEIVDTSHHHNLALEEGGGGGGRSRSSPSPVVSQDYNHYQTTSGNNTANSSRSEITKYQQTTPREAREYSPQGYTGNRSGVQQSYAYSSSTTRESRSEVPRSPPPHRSPSPVSFNSPPSPGRARGTPYTYDPPPPPQRSQVSHSYKYSTTSSNSYSGGRPKSPAEEPLLPRPFPSPSPQPGEQRPPKKLDELMAEFSSETEIRNRRNETYHSSQQQRYEREFKDSHRDSGNDHNRNPPQTPLKADHPNPPLTNGRSSPEKMKEKQQIVKKDESKNLEGPPVYYPPGVELFSKKEEAMAQQQSGGGMYKAKAKYEYEAKSKSKSKESSGKAVVPVCLPVCCAMPCTIL